MGDEAFTIALTCELLNSTHSDRDLFETPFELNLHKFYIGQSLK